MADTTYYDLPYPASTDKVSLGYLNMQDLAEQIDTILNDANIPIVGDGANVLRTDTVFGGVLDGTYDALTLDNDAVTTSKILNDAVTTAKILDANVTGAKIESSVALAGSPTTTTQATADDSTRIATTEFVNNVAADLVLGIVAPGTITNTMLAGGITNAKIDNSAAIAYSKLNLATSILNADVSASAAIAYSKLNLATSIVNADISASAAIVDTKLDTISTASKVSNSATTATSANTASAIVARDASGNFTAGTIAATNIDLSGYLDRGAPVTKTADFTVAATENWLISNKASSCTVTLPTASSFTGRELMIKNLAAFTVVSASSNVKPIGTNTAGTAILPATAGTWCTLVSDGTDWIVMQSGPGLFS
jgi:outer membrane murein-binding lipoprotein Lpp